MPALFHSLLEKYLTDSLSEEEARLFEQYMLDDAGDTVTLQCIADFLHNGVLKGENDLVLREISFRNISRRIDDEVVNKSVRMGTWRQWSAAAAVFIIVCTGVVLWILGTNHRPAEMARHKAETIVPGEQGAILMLAGGKEVSLDNIQEGVVALQSGIKASVVNGTLVYEGEGTETLYNTMRTPNGRFFNLQLPDGTRVWLNAASTIRYPVVFKGNERKVELNGEAYFEVAQHSSLPFKVMVANKAEVQVLGTDFNINAYADEKEIAATLVNGAVRCVAGRQTLLLTPGQQARLSVLAIQNQSLRLVEHPDMEKVLAWKNGLFDFNGVTIEEIARQLTRWYDIEVKIEGQPPVLHFYGAVDRALSFEGMLRSLHQLGVSTRLEGRILYITSK